MLVFVKKEKKHTISPYIFMQFAEPLGTSDSSVDAGWDFLHDCWQPKLIEKVKELAPTMIRWGGCFASYYHWKEAVGPQSERVPMLNLCWDGTYSNMVGTQEVIDLCKIANSEPLLVVNMESDGRMHWAYPKEGMNRLGTAEEAAEWVDYCNNPQNALRLSHGIKEPYNVRFWQIGNETSYDKRGFDVETTAQKTLEFARAMRKADPNVKLLAWGDSGWAKRICEVAGDEIDYIAFHYHFYDSGLPDCPLNDFDYRTDPDNTWRHLMNTYQSLESYIDGMREQVKPYGKRLAMTEGHYLLDGRDRCDVLSTWGAGVSYARCMNVLERATDILDIATLADFFGNRWQVNALMLCTPDHWGAAYLQPVGEVMRLFRHHIGRYALEVEKELEQVDLTASLSADEKTLYLHAVNTDRVTDKMLTIAYEGKRVKRIKVFWIAEDAMTEITYKNVDVFQPKECTVDGDTFVLPAAAVAALEVEFA